MATTSFLYHAMGLRGYKHLRTAYRGGAIYHHVRRGRHKRRCRECRARWHELRLEGTFERQFRALPVGGRPQFVVLHGHRQHCKRCGFLGREPIDFAAGQARHIKAFGRFAVSLCALAPIKVVASWLGVGWDLVKDLYKAELKRRLRRRRLGRVRYIAVDEFATKKGQVYMTAVLDLESGQIIHVQEGNDTQALIGFLRRLKRARAPLRAVALDMSAAYAKAVREVWGDRVDLVFDPFHVVALANRAIDETRRDLMRELEADDKRVTKGCRFLLLFASENLTDDRRAQLRELMAANEPLYEVYLAKEGLRHFWHLPDIETAATFLTGWIAMARDCASTHFRRLAATIESHRDGLLAYFRHRITTGPLEGINNKIKVLKRQAYGFRDMEYFKLRVLFLNESTYAFPG